MAGAMSAWMMVSCVRSALDHDSGCFDNGGNGDLSNGNGGNGCGLSCGYSDDGCSETMMSVAVSNGGASTRNGNKAESG